MKLSNILAITNISNMDNLIEIDKSINIFIEKYNSGIKTIYRSYHKNFNDVEFKAFIQSLLDELRTGYVSFINNSHDIEGINDYLFYIINSYCKNNFKLEANQSSKKYIEYICPGCSFLGKTTVLSGTYILSCGECQELSESIQDPKLQNLFSYFRLHNKSGYKCFGCERFIPQPQSGTTIKCPYIDCVYVGDMSAFKKKMHHPTAVSKKVSISLNTDLQDDIDLSKTIEDKNLIDFEIKILKDVINLQSGSIYYSGSDYTVTHKSLIYASFLKILEKYPQDTLDYLLHSSRSGGFQSKIFQEYISLLEKAIPFTYKKGYKIYTVDSLLSENLSIFNGISSFEATINNGIIKNNTKEIYIGSRKGSYVEPYYLGKIISILDLESKKSLTDNIKEYSFSKIKIANVKDGTRVLVDHLRIPPHYQMGPMMLINRIRKKIVDKTLSLLQD